MDERRILVVDDERALRCSLVEHLVHEGFVAHEAATGGEALATVRAKGAFDAVLLDYRLPDANGVDILDEIKRTEPATQVIMMTGFASVQVAVEAMKRGAADYATKPLDIAELIRLLQSLCLRGSAGRSTMPPAPSEASLIGDSDAMRRVRALVERVALSPVSTVLVTGESGTGKDLVARAVHSAGHRARNPFVNITCSALPENLLESELFGHEAGAFTSAARQKRGLFELADGGTIFLDEIAEMPPSLQAKLLRFIEERAFRRVGGTKDINVDVRVIAATNRDLPAEVSAGRFRGDLYYRLRVVPIHLPPLRERHGDVALLSAHFIAQFSSIFGKDLKGIEPAGLAALEQYDWPGNVRELKHALEHAVLIAESEYLGAEECGRAPASSGTFVTFRLPREGVVLAQLERSLVVQALELTGWNQVRAARLLGLNRDQIRYRIEKFRLSRSSGGHAA